MEEKNTQNWEELNLNSNTEEVITTEPQEPQKVFTLEEVEAMRKEMTSNSEKWVQKVISEKKAWETALKESWKVAVSPERLVELFEENPKVAQIILDEFYEWESIEDYKERIEYKEDYTDPKIVQAKIKKEAEKLAQNNQIEVQKQAFIEKLKMTDEEKESFEETFEDLRQLKSFNIKDLTKQLEKAYRLSTDNEESISKLKTQETIAKTMWTWDGKSSINTTKETKSGNLESEIEAFKKKHKL